MITGLYCCSKLRDCVNNCHDLGEEPLCGQIGQLILFDSFLQPMVAGSIDDTLADPGPGLRDVVVDTENKISIADSNLVISGGKAVPAWGDPGIWWTTTCDDPIPRKRGRTLGGIVSADDIFWAMFGWDDDEVLTIDANAIHINSNRVIEIREGGATVQVTSALVDETEYKFYVMLRWDGAYYFVSGGTFGEMPVLIAISQNETTELLYPGFVNNRGINYELDAVTVADLLPKLPLYADTFSSVVAIDSGDNELHGQHVRVGLTGSAGRYGGAGRTNIYSTLLTDWWDETSEDGVIVRCYINDDTPSDTQSVIYLWADGSNYIQIRKDQAAATWTLRQASGGTTKYVTRADIYHGWNTLALSNSKTNNQFKAWNNGTQVGSTQPGVGTWAGDFNSAHAEIGADSQVSGKWFDGQVSDVILYRAFANYSQLATQMADIHNKLEAGTLVASDLDSAFGSGEWAWYKNNETHESNGGVESIRFNDIGGNHFTALHHRVVLDGETALYDIGSYTDLFSNEFDAVFDGSHMSVICEIEKPILWSDGANNQEIFTLYDDANNQVSVRILADRRVNWNYEAGGVLRQDFKTTDEPRDRLVVGINVSDNTNDNILEGFYDGSSEGQLAVGAAWNGGGLDPTRTLAGATTMTLGFLRGKIHNLIATVNGTQFSIAQHALISAALAAGTLTPTILSSYVGYGNWVWWQMNQPNPGGAGVPVLSDVHATDSNRAYAVIEPAVLNDLELLMDGDMEAPGTGAWTAINSGILSKEGSAYEGSQCIRITYGGSPSPAARQNILTVGKRYHVTGRARSEGSSEWRFQDGGGVTLASGSSSSWTEINKEFIATSAGYIYLRAQISAAGWVEFDALSITEIFLIDGDMEAAGTSAWEEVGGCTASKENGARTGGSGTQVLRGTIPVANAAASLRQATLEIGKEYHITGWARGDGTNGYGIINTLGKNWWTSTTANAWQYFDFVFVSTSAHIYFYTRGNVATEDYCEWDDIIIERTELFANGDFVNWTADDPDQWGIFPAEDANHEICEVAAGQAHANCGGLAGDHANFYRVGGAATQAGQNITTLVPLCFVRFEIDIDNVVSGGIRMLHGAGYATPVYGSAGVKLSSQCITSASLALRSEADPTDLTLDSVSAKYLALKDILILHESDTADVYQTCKYTITDDFQAGVATNWNSVSNPQSGILGYHDRQYGHSTFVKYVNGVRTELAKVADAYNAGARITIRVNPATNTFYFEYDGVAIANAVISDEEIISNTLHGRIVTDNDSYAEDEETYDVLVSHHQLELMF